MNRPYEFEEAQRRVNRAAEAQQAAETAMREHYRDFADAEEAYRVALARRIVELHNDGVAWSVCADLARGDENVAQLRRLRDIEEGKREASSQAAWRLAADRRDITRLIEWSMRRDLAEDPEPSEMRTFGSRTAA